MSEPYSNDEWTKLVTPEVQKRLRTFAWRHFEWVETLPYGIDPGDLIQEAELLLWSGRRTWAGEKCPEKKALPLLCATVRQLACKWGKRFESQKRNAATQIEPEAFELLPTPDGTSAEILVQKLLDLIRGDELLVQMVEYLLDYPEAREAKIADALGVERRKIYQANKRLGRKCKRLLKEIEQQKQEPELV